MVMFWTMFLGCNASDDESSDDPVVKAKGITEMDAVSLLTRVSLDLRGVRPTEGEIDQVVADPEAVEGLIDAFLLDPRFGDRVMDLWSEIYLLNAEYSAFSAYNFGLSDQAGFSEAQSQEALRILAHVASNDMPWTEVVMGDWTMMNEVLSQVVETDYPDGATGWQQSHYTDGRPPAGVLSASTMWWRYQSTDSNANRKRANTASRVLLCNDYLVRPIDFDRNVNLLDEGSVLDALKTNPSCVSCHVSLDPLAGYFYGFWVYNEDSQNDATTYHPEREVLWQSYTDIEPGYYGEEGSSLADLGYQIAMDSRFAECAVEQAYELLLRRDAELDDDNNLTRHRNAFIEGDLTLRALIRSVVDDPYYRAGTSTEGQAVTLKMATPDLLARQVEDLTGFKWEYFGYDMLISEAVGVRTLAGGADGETVTANATNPNATIVLVQQRLAELASGHLVQNEVQMAAADRRLFTEVDFDEQVGGDVVDQQIVALHKRVLGNLVDLDSDEVAAHRGLWESIIEVDGDPEVAWTGVLYAMLRDPEFLMY